jgi:hypothetical protein
MVVGQLRFLSPSLPRARALRERIKIYAHSHPRVHAWHPRASVSRNASGPAATQVAWVCVWVAFARPPGAHTIPCRRPAGVAQGPSSVSFLVRARLRGGRFCS